MKKNMLRGVIGIALTLSLSTPFVVAQAATKAPAKATSAKDVGGLKELIKLAKAEGELNTIALPDYWANYGNVIKAFEKKYGIKVVETSPVDFGKLRAMVDSGNVEWDLTEIGGQDAIRAGKLNLLDKVDPKVVDRSKYPPTAQNPFVFASSVYTTIIGYRTDVFKGGTHPKSWADWWDVKKFPGARSMRNHPTDNLEFALIADGVPKDKLYPIDFDRAFKKLDQIKPHVTVWWSTGQQPAQLLLDKEVVLATGWNGRFYDIIKKGAPVEPDPPTRQRSDDGRVSGSSKRARTSFCRAVSLARPASDQGRRPFAGSMISDVRTSPSMRKPSSNRTSP